MPPEPIRWLFHSPRHLALGVTALAVVAGLGIAGVRSDESPSAVERAPVAATASPEPEWPRPDTGYATRLGHARQAHSPGHKELVSRVDREAAAAVARNFTLAWLRGSSRRPADVSWLDQLGNYTTPQLLQGIRLTDPQAIPAGRLARLQLVAVGAHAAEVQVRVTTGEQLKLTVVRQQKGWAVADIREARAR